MQEMTLEERIAWATRNRRTILAIILMGVFVAVLDVQIVAIALPTITRAFGATIGMTQWIATAYVITVLATVIIFGTLSSAIGNGRLFKAGLLIFTISSLACGLSSQLPELIFFRVTQALGASMLMSISIAIILQVFPREEQGRAMGFCTSVIALGLIAGPATGGFVVDTIGWPYIFFVNVPIGILLLALSLRCLIFDPPRKEIRHHDPAGSILLVVLMAALALALNTLANPPVNYLYFFAWTGIFLVSLAAFIHWEKRQKVPFLDITALSDRRFLLPAVSLILYLLATFILLTSQPFYFEGTMKLRPSHIGVLALVTPVVMMLFAPLAGWIYDRYPWKGYPFTGILAMGLAFIACGAAFAKVDISLIVLSFVVIGVARAVFQGPNSIEIMAAVPQSMKGVGSSLIVSLQNLGIIFGISLTTILLTGSLAGAGYYGQVTDADPALLAGIFGQIMVVGGCICLIGAACSWKK